MRKEGNRIVKRGGWEEEGEREKNTRSLRLLLLVPTHPDARRLDLKLNPVLSCYISFVPSLNGQDSSGGWRRGGGERLERASERAVVGGLDSFSLFWMLSLSFPLSFLFSYAGSLKVRLACLFVAVVARLNFVSVFFSFSFFLVSHLSLQGARFVSSSLPNAHIMEQAHPPCAATPPGTRDHSAISSRVSSDERRSRACCAVGRAPGSCAQQSEMRARIVGGTVLETSRRKPWETWGEIASEKKRRSDCLFVF